MTTYKTTDISETVKSCRQWLAENGAHCDVSQCQEGMLIEVRDRRSFNSGVSARLDQWLLIRGLRVCSRGNIGVRMGVVDKLVAYPQEPTNEPVRCGVGARVEDSLLGLGRDVIEHILPKPRFDRSGIELLLGALNRQGGDGPNLSNWREWTG